MRNGIADQATGLRQLFRSRLATVLPIVMPQRKGNTTAFGQDQQAWQHSCDRALFVVRLAQALAHTGRRPIVLDGDQGLMAPSLGLRARFDLQYLLQGDLAAGDVVLSGNYGLSVVPAVRGLRAIGQDTRTEQSLRLPRLLSQLQYRDPADALAFDTALICSDVATVLPLLSERTSEVMVLCPNDPQQREAIYSTIKALLSAPRLATLRMVYHGFESAAKAKSYHVALAAIVDRFLGFTIAFAGVTTAPAALAAAYSEWDLVELTIPDSLPDEFTRPHASIN